MSNGMLPDSAFSDKSLWENENYYPVNQHEEETYNDDNVVASSKASGTDPVNPQLSNSLKMIMLCGKNWKR